MKIKKILVITGNGNPAIIAMNNYVAKFHKKKIDLKSEEITFITILPGLVQS